MLKTLYYCDATGALLKEEEVRAALSLAAEYTKEGKQAPGHFAEKFHPFLPAYWDLYNETLLNELKRVNATLEKQRRKFFQQRLVEMRKHD